MKSCKFYLVLLITLLISICIQGSYANTAKITSNPHLINISIKNKGGFVLRTKRFFKKNDNSFIIKTKSFPIAKTKNYNIPEYSEIYLHAVAAGGWSKCALVKKDGCTINCSRGSLNMNCYFSQQDCGTIRGISNESCNYAIIKYSQDDKTQEVSSVDIGPEDKGSITVKNTGSTSIRHFQLNFLTNEYKPDIQFAKYFEGECLNIKELNAGESCKLNYQISKYETLNPIYHITTTGDGITKNNQLSINVRSVYFWYSSYENIIRCLIKNDHTFTNCKNAQEWKDKIKNVGAYDLKLQKHGEKIHVYFSYNAKEIHACNLNLSTGKIDSCILVFNLNKNHSLYKLGKIAFSEDGNLVYFGETMDKLPDIKKTLVMQCKVNKINGRLEECKDSEFQVPATVKNFYGIRKIITNKYIHKMYFVYAKRNHGKTGVIVCNINNKNLYGCHIALDIPETKTITYKEVFFDIKFISTDLAYVLSLFSRIDICHVNTETGILNNCRNSNATKINHSDFMLIDKKRQYSYIVNFSGVRVIGCNILYDNSLKNCKFAFNPIKAINSMQFFPVTN